MVMPGGRVFALPVADCILRFLQSCYMKKKSLSKKAEHEKEIYIWKLTLENILKIR